MIPSLMQNGKRNGCEFHPLQTTTLNKSVEARKIVGKVG